MNEGVEEEFMVDEAELSGAEFEFVTSWKRGWGSRSKRILPVVAGAAESWRISWALLNPGRLFITDNGGTAEAAMEVEWEGCCRGGWRRWRVGRQTGRLARLGLLSASVAAWIAGSHVVQSPTLSALGELLSASEYRAFSPCVCAEKKFLLLLRPFGSRISWNGVPSMSTSN